MTVIKNFRGVAAALVVGFSPAAAVAQQSFDLGHLPSNTEVIIKSFRDCIAAYDQKTETTLTPNNLALFNGRDNATPIEKMIIDGQDAGTCARDQFLRLRNGEPVLINRGCYFSIADKITKYTFEFRYFAVKQDEETRDWNVPDHTLLFDVRHPDSATWMRYYLDEKTFDSVTFGPSIPASAPDEAMRTAKPFMQQLQAACLVGG